MHRSVNYYYASVYGRACIKIFKFENWSSLPDSRSNGTRKNCGSEAASAQNDINYTNDLGPAEPEYLFQRFRLRSARESKTQFSTTHLLWLQQREICFVIYYSWDILIFPPSAFAIMYVRPFYDWKSGNTRYKNKTFFFQWWNYKSLMNSKISRVKAKSPVRSYEMDTNKMQFMCHLQHCTHLASFIQFSTEIRATRVIHIRYRLNIHCSWQLVAHISELYMYIKFQNSFRKEFFINLDDEKFQQKNSIKVARALPYCSNSFETPQLAVVPALAFSKNKTGSLYNYARVRFFNLSS